MTNNIEKIKQLAIEGRTEEALNQLVHICETEKLDHEITALQLKTRHSALEQQINEGIIAEDDKKIELAKITKSLFSILIQFQREEAEILRQKKEENTFQQQGEETFRKKKEEIEALHIQEEIALQQKKNEVENLRQQREAAEILHQNEEAKNLQQQENAKKIQLQEEEILRKKRAEIEASRQKEEEKLHQKRNEIESLRQQREEAEKVRQNEEAKALQQQEEAKKLQLQEEEKLRKKRAEVETLRQQREKIEAQRKKEANKTDSNNNSKWAIAGVFFLLVIGLLFWLFREPTIKKQATLIIENRIIFKGKVLHADLTAAAFAIVNIDRNAAIANTDDDGNFSLSIPDSTAKKEKVLLIITYKGNLEVQRTVRLDSTIFKELKIN